ncbi:MAG: hypothetical protein K6F57_04505 [Candidatus Saccharibacteria bacterium]|nr:hypothetical protein [Candidatus Saccharibacteria bacterium]
MKKTNRAIIATAAVAVAATTIAPLGNVFAASAPEWGANGSSATIVRKIANAYGTINNTFGYTITADTNNPTGATGAPTAVPSITFNDSYSTQGEASKSATLDFSGMQFERAGDYAYTITENSSTDGSVYPVDETNSYTAIISVRNNNDLTGFVAILYVKDSSNNKISDISGDDSAFEFASTPAYTNIQVTHTVSGNAADLTTCFDYTITFSTSDSYTLNTESDCDNPDKVANNSTIKLKHGDTATIGINNTVSEIPVGTTYTISKSGTDEYTTTIDGTEQTSTGTKTMVATNAPAYNTANKTAIDEKFNSAVDTGATMNIAIYILLALAGAAGVYYVARKKLANKA